MPIGSTIPTTGYMYPEIFAIGGFEDELIKVSVMLEPVEPLAGGLKVGMTLVVIPSCVRSQGQADVSGLAQSVLGGIGATNLHIELVATVAGADDDRAANEPAERF